MGAVGISGRPPDGTVGFLHVDMDAFFAAVEIHRRPGLRGKPVVVGGAGRRGVVAAASYEARAFGVGSAMPSARARKLCPHAVFLPGDHRCYSEVSARIMAVLEEVTPLVEPLSLDEAFLDVRGAIRSLGPAERIAASIRERVLEQEGLTCSVGVASNKLLAKLATERAKPRPSPSGPVFGPGVYAVAAGAELDFLHPLPVAALWGVGPATARRLSAMGVETVGDLAAQPADRIAAALGAANGHRLHRLARGIDDSPVTVDRSPKSIGHEETYPRDLTTRAELDVELTRLADAVASRLREAEVRARTVTVKVRFGDFTTITRSVTLPDPVDGTGAVASAAAGLLDRIDPAPGVRLLGISGSGLTAESVRQLTLIDDEAASPDRSARRDQTDPVVDEIRARFGSSSIGPASLARPGDRLGVRDRDKSRPWGPDAD